MLKISLSLVGLRWLQPGEYIVEGSVPNLLLIGVVRVFMFAAFCFVVLLRNYGGLAIPRSALWYIFSVQHLYNTY